MGPDTKSAKEYVESSSIPGEAPLERRRRIRRSNLAVTAIALIALIVIAAIAEFQDPHGEPLAEPPSITSFQGFFFPLERNRFLRPDTAGSNTKTAQYHLNAVSFSLTGEKGWAVGANATLLHTENGGRSWMLKSVSIPPSPPALRPPPEPPLPPGPPQRPSAGLISNAFAGPPSGPPPNAPFAPEGSSGATVQRPLDLPPQQRMPDVQQKAPAPARAPELKNIDPAFSGPEQKAFPPAQPNVQQIPPPPILGVPPQPVIDFKDVHFLADGKRGWIVGSAGTILHTRDGGVTWERRASNTRFDLQAVSFDANGARGWIAGAGGEMLVTNDGGETWDFRSTGASESLTAVSVTQNGPGWAVGDGGAIVFTKDRGLTWQSYNGWFGVPLRSLSADATGQRAVAVGDRGVIVATSDGGTTWKLSNTKADVDLASVLFVPPGQLGWAVGAGGTVLRTRDGAAKWTASTVSPRTFLRSIAFADDGRRGLIVGDTFTILTTRDGGATWHRVAHQRFPAPWFYVAGALLLTWLGVRYRRNYRHAQEDDTVASIIDKGESDEPIVRVTQDRLGFGRLVKGLSGYLRNRATVPPLTIAISAPWGGGKSSLMSMLRTEMRAVGVRSVWFNAWHHQKEEVMLASLLESIRAQALPFWLTPEGLTFRAKLLWRRARVHPLFSFIACCALFLAGWHLLGALFGWIDDRSKFEGGWVEYVAQTVATIWDSPEAGAGADKHLLDKLLDGKLTEFVVGTMSTVFGRPETLLYSIEVAVLVAIIVMVLLYGLRAFPGSPGVLLASVASQFKIAQVQAQTSYRQRFRRHFMDVCEALRPRTMLIFIDDLDRCEPAKTAEMLEAINYLANSGPCFIIVGMAREIVEAQLSIHFDKVADAHKIAAAHGDRRQQGAPISMQANAPPNVRIHYVQSYLRKLINLEIQIPELTREKMHSLLGVEGERDTAPEEIGDTRSRTRRIADALEHTWDRHAALITATALVLAAVGLVMYVQAGIKDWDTKRVARIGDERKSAGERIEKIRDAEQRAAVALDFARGKEKRIATRLFERYKVAVAGLEFRLPLGDFEPGKTPVAELCKEEFASGAKPLDVSDVDQSAELACWRKSATATRAVEQRLNDIRASLAAASAARSYDAFDRVARELAKSKKMADEAEHISGTLRDTTLTAAATPTTVASSAPTATAQSKNTAGAGARESEHVTWPYALMLAIILPAAFYALTRREPYVLKDEPYFRDALRVWSPLLGSDSAFTVPREVKRFQNRTRFYAMRLREPKPRAHWYDRLVNWIERREGLWQTQRH